MGNKRALASSVAELCSTLPDGEPVIDLFGGMCNVAGALAQARRVEVNDVQRYAELAARCLIASRTGPPRHEEISAHLLAAFEANRACLRERFASELEEEDRLLTAGDPASLEQLSNEWPHPGEDRARAAEIASLRFRPEPPYRLCTLTFAHGYFGLAQSIDLDSLRFAIDTSGPKLDSNKRRWLRLALLQCASRVASTPGHFAQFLRPRSVATADRIRGYRRRSIWSSFLEDVNYLRPYGTIAWRRGNQVHRAEAEAVVRSREGRAIYYADPPYSKEHYSRFYHVLETIERYDYPEAIGAGRYRPDRFYSPFARASAAADACRSLFSAISSKEGTLLFSYPSSGLLDERCGASIQGLLEDEFGEVRLAIDRRAHHSTLGARHGSPSREIREQVWLAR